MKNLFFLLFATIVMTSCGNSGSTSEQSAEPAEVAVDSVEVSTEVVVDSVAVDSVPAE